MKRRASRHADPDVPDVTLGDFGIAGARVTAGWLFEQDAMELRAFIEVRDVRDPTRAEGVVTRETIDGDSWMAMTDAVRAEMVRRLVMQALSHEVDEWLRVDGKLVREPHPKPAIAVSLYERFAASGPDATLTITMAPAGAQDGAK